MRAAFYFLLTILSTIFYTTFDIYAYDSSKFQQAIKAGTIKVNISKTNLEELHEASTLVVSCVDFRLRDEVANLCNIHLGLLDDYDEIALPGAALGLDAPQYAHWKRTIHDVVDLLRDLHHIEKIVLIDHRGCGAYKLLKGKEAVSTKDKEYQEHKKVLWQVKSQLKAKFPKLEVYTLLMGLDGVVEVIN
jgi:hypothetical protein